MRSGQAFSIKDFGGLRSLQNERGAPPTMAKVAFNVFANEGTLQVRPGFRKSLAGQSGVLDPQGWFLPPFKVVAMQAFMLRGRYALLAFAINTAPGSSERDRFALFVGSNPNPVVTGSFRLAGETDEIPVGMAVELHGVIYIAAGGDSLIKSKKIVYDPVGDQYLVQRVGILPPDTAPTVQLDPPAGVGVGPQGVVSYRFTSYNELTDTESSPHAGEAQIDNSVGPPLAVRVFGNVPKPLDDQITHARVYRRDIGFDATWYRIATVPVAGGGAWEHFDEIPLLQTTKVPGFQIPIIGSQPPGGKVLAWYKNAMFWSAANLTNVMRFSEVQRPEVVDPRDGLELGSGSEGITYALEAFGRLLVFKEQSIWQISGSTPGSFSTAIVTAAAGCIAPHSVRWVKGELYFLSVDGPMALSPNGIRSLHSGKIRDFNDQLFDRSKLRLVNAAVYKDFDSYILCGDADGPELSSPFVQPTYDYERKEFTNQIMPASAIREQTTGFRSRVYAALADNSGLIGYMEEEITGDGDLTEKIDWEWTTVPINFDTALTKKIYFVTLVVAGDPDTLGDDVEVTARILTDLGDSINLGVKRIDDRAQITFRVGAVCNTALFQFFGLTRSALKISSIEVDLERIEFSPDTRTKELRDDEGAAPGAFLVQESDQAITIDEGATPQPPADRVTWTLDNSANNAPVNVLVLLPFFPNNWLEIEGGVTFDQKLVQVPAFQTMEVVTRLSQPSYVARQDVGLVRFKNLSIAQPDIDRALTFTVNEVIDPGELSFDNALYLAQGVTGRMLTFNPQTKQYTLTNIGEGQITVNSQGTGTAFTLGMATISIDSVQIVIPGGGSVVLEAGLNRAACAAQPIGVYTGEIHLSVTGGSGSDTIPVQINVIQDDGPPPDDDDPPEIVPDPVEGVPDPQTPRIIVTS